jgi:hypothetical protein
LRADGQRHFDVTIRVDKPPSIRLLRAPVRDDVES